MPSVLEDAISELQNAKRTWERIVSDLSSDPNRQISSYEAKRIRNTFEREEHRLNYTFTWQGDNYEYAQEFRRFKSEISSRLDIAIMGGQQRYDNEMHRRKIETIKTWGTFLNDIKFNVVAFGLGILSMVGYLFIKH